MCLQTIFVQILHVYYKEPVISERLGKGTYCTRQVLSVFFTILCYAAFMIIVHKTLEQAGQ